ncbi:phage tail tape measure protein [Otariodibacter oris]|uniref:Minor tail protein n=1 Tax=Otariodibacter oris TaxID=1032623 RepID=A0A420XJ52_9PAST|nr:phage tail tape measure protein [Otariodibacter oris]QGM80659.1 hypothetical protein A6A10_04200 [Otariodibacter oris]RKR77181.1 minor tail protein [Otariodibacter oris]
MAKNFTMSLLLKVQDYASKAIQGVSQKVKQSNKEIENSTKQTARVQQQTVKQTEQVTNKANRSAIYSSQQLARAREGLGVRSERQIQREISRTVAQYNRLARSGTASAREIARAQDVARQRVKELNAEMGKMPTGQRMGNMARGAMALTAGIGVGARLISDPIKSTANYDLKLAYLANTAYSDRDKAGRKEGMQNIHQAIKTAMSYGGDENTVIDALSEIISKGKVSVDDALSLLPTIQMNATATGASTLDIAALVNSGLGYGIEQNQIQDFIDYANAAGKAGGFELKDMAQYAPSLFAAANGAGLKGLDGAKEMFKILQQVTNVSGGSSETATNTMNFLAKLNSQDTINRASNIDYVDKNGKAREVDLKASMAGYMGQGKSPVEAFLSIVDDILVGDKEYQKAIHDLQNASTEGDRAEALNRIADYMEGSRVGELVADRQAWLGLYGVRSQKKTSENVEEAYQSALGGTAQDADFIMDTAAMKFQKAENVKKMGEIESFRSITDATGDIAEKLANYGEEYPKLTSALVGATESVKALAGAAVTAAGAMALFGGRDFLPDLLSRGKGGIGKTSVAGTASGISSGLSKSGRLSRLLGAGSTLLSGTGYLGMIGAIGEQQPYQQARSEMEEEKRVSAKVKFAKAYNNGETKSSFYYGGPSIQSKETKPLYGGYALAYLAQDNKVAQARYEIGGYSQEQMDSRTQRNNELMNGFSTLGNTIGEALKVGLSQQSKVIDNRITVELDGRVVGEAQSQYLFNEAIRG